MQKIYINNWLAQKGRVINLNAELDRELALDFSNVEEIRLNDVEKILDLQKYAVFNGVKISVQNMKPGVSRVFEQTGLYKMMDTVKATRALEARKRQGLAFD